MTPAPEQSSRIEAKVSSTEDDVILDNFVFDGRTSGSMDIMDCVCRACSPPRSARLLRFEFKCEAPVGACIESIEDIRGLDRWVCC